MEDSADDIESVYSDAALVTRHVHDRRTAEEPPTRIATTVKGGTTGFQRMTASAATRSNPTSFLDLPTELRDEIYRLILPQGKKLRIGFAYDCTLPPHLSWNPKRKYQGTQYLRLLPDDVFTVYWTCIIEQLPPLAHSSLGLQDEVLEVYYAQNAVDLKVRNFLDRRLCTQWIADRGGTLKRLRELRLHIPIPFVYWPNPLVAIITASPLGSAPGFVRMDEIFQNSRGFWTCTCSFARWVKRTLETHRRHPDPGYERVRAMDLGPVVEKMVEVLEAVEWAEGLWEARNPRVMRDGKEEGGRTAAHYVEERRECGECGRRAVYPEQDSHPSSVGGNPVFREP